MSKPRTLSEVDPDEKGKPYFEFKAEELNQLFKERGLQKEAGKILPSTVLDGLRKYAKAKPAASSGQAQERA